MGTDREWGQRSTPVLPPDRSPAEFQTFLGLRIAAEVTPRDAIRNHSHRCQQVKTPMHFQQQLLPWRSRRHRSCRGWQTAHQLLGVCL